MSPPASIITVYLFSCGKSLPTPWEARALERSVAGLWRPSHFARENSGRYNSHHCQKGSAQHCWDKGRCWWKHEVSGAGWGGDRGGVRGRDGRLKRVPKLPASDDQSVHQRGLTGAHWNSSAGRTKKHPPWESAFSPARRRVMDWAGRCTQCICEEKRGWGAERWWGAGKVCQKNTSTLLLECTKIFKAFDIYFIIPHIRCENGHTHKWKRATKGLKSHAALHAEEVQAKTKKGPGECKCTRLPPVPKAKPEINCD